MVLESQVDKFQKYRYRRTLMDRYQYEENAYIHTDTNSDPIIGQSLHYLP